MEQKYIDNFFKDKLEHREVAFSEDAWLAAEKMIVAEEQKRRWGGLGRLWFLLPFLIAGLVLYVYQNQPTDLPIHQNGMSVIPFMLQGEEESTTTSFEEMEVNNQGTATFNTTENEEASASPEGDASVVVAGTAVTELAIEENTENSILKKSSPESKQTPAKTLVPPNKKTEKPVTKKAKKEVPMAFNEVESSTKGNTKIEVEIAKLVENQTVETIASSTTPIAPVAYEKGQHSVLDLASTDFQLEQETPVAKQAALHYYKRNRFNVGLLSSAIVTPSFNDKIIGLSGMNIGGTFSYRLTPRWSVNADLLYEFHGRNYAFPNGNNSLTYEYQSYGFGLDDNTYNVKVKQSHLLTLPLYMKYHIGSHSIDLGVQGAYTLGLRGKIEEETISSIETASTREAKTTWVDSDRVSPYQFNVMLGYQFAISKRFSVGLRSVIVPSRLPRHGKDDENAFNPLEIIGIGGPEPLDGEKQPIPLFAHNAINFHFTVQYNLNRKVRHITKPLMGL